MFVRDFFLIFFSTPLPLFGRSASEGPLKGIMGYTEDHVVSSDFVGDKRYNMV